MPLLTPEMKKALRQVQADKLLNKKELAKYIGVSENTAKSITKDNEPQNVKNKVFNAVVSQNHSWFTRTTYDKRKISQSNEL